MKRGCDTYSLFKQSKKPMNLKKEFNRLSGLFGDSMESLHSIADEVGGRVYEESGQLAKRARKTLRRDRGMLEGAEEMFEQHMKQNSTIYVFLALALLGVIIARMVSYSSPPAEREW